MHSVNRMHSMKKVRFNHQGPKKLLAFAIYGSDVEAFEREKKALRAAGVPDTRTDSGAARILLRRGFHSQAIEDQGEDQELREVA